MTTQQVLATGMSRDGLRGLVKQGQWTRVATGVHSTSPAPPSWEQLAWGGVLVGGPMAALGGMAAAHLFGLADPTTPIDVWTPEGSPVIQRPQGPWRFRRGVRRVVGHPPRTSLDETILDLCSGASPDDQSHWIAAALRSRKTTPERLTRALERAPRVGGRQQISELLQVVGGGSESPLEVRYFRDVQRPHGLPEGIRQRSVSSRTRSDVVFEGYGLIVELDGDLGHRGAGERRDAWRDAHHLALGLVTLRFGWADLVGYPCEVAAAIAEVLHSRGWEGAARPCRACIRAA